MSWQDNQDELDYDSEVQELRDAVEAVADALGCAESCENTEDFKANLQEALDQLPLIEGWAADLREMIENLQD